MARVRVNDLVLEPFQIHSGTRQGCPLCPLLFVLAIEPLAVKLKEEDRVKGLHIGESEECVSLYADD